MNIISRILNSYWLKVPDVLYLVLLFGGGVFAAVSAGILIYGVIKKKEFPFFKKWIAVLAVALLLVVLTMTGKIAPEMAFNG